MRAFSVSTVSRSWSSASLFDEPTPSGGGARTRLGLEAVAGSLLVALLCLPAPAGSQDAYFSLSSQGLSLPGQIPTVQVSGRNVSEVDFRVYRVPDARAFFLAQANLRSPRPVSLEKTETDAASMRQSLREIRERATRSYRDLARALLDADLRSYLAGTLAPEGAESGKAETRARPGGSEKPPLLTNYPLVREFTHHLRQEGREWWASDSVALFENGAPTGTYLVEAISGGKRAYTVSMVSNLRYVAKQGPSSEDDLLVFVASGDSGKPVAGASILTMNEENPETPPQQATTDGRGMALLSAVRGSQTFMVSREGDFLLGGASFYFDAEDWESGDVATGRRGLVYVYTDRPVYRPGHQVFFKALLRSKDREGRYSPAPDETVSVTALDPMSRSIYQTELAANGLGSVTGDLQISSEPALGSYTLRIDWAGRSYYGCFRVEEYKKPEFEVTVTTDRPHYVSGDRILTTIDATYYFGDPVAGGKLDYEVYQADYWRPWWEDLDLDWYFAGEEGYATYNYALVGQGDGVLDRDGKLTVEIPTDGRERDAMVRIVARVTDSTNRQTSGSCMVRLAAGTFSINLTSERYATAAGEPIAFSFATKDASGDPVSKRLAVDLIHQRWERGQTVEDRLETREVETDASGVARLEITPRQPGSYRLEVRAEDERGNRLRSEYHFWVWSGEPWWAESVGTGLTLTPDRKMYSASDTAQLLLLSPVENPTVLFTVEGPTLLEYRILQVSGTTTSIPMPLEANYSPNVFVTATVVSGGQFFEANQVLVIPPRDRFLQIDISTDRPTYKPGEEVQIDLSVKDEAGRPVDAEVSVGVVDQAVYAVAPDKTADIRTFFYGKRANEVRTNLSTGYYMYSSSHEEVARFQAPQDLTWADFKTVAETKVRKLFKDTMLWQAVVRTGSSGKVRIPATTPDNLTTWRITVRATDADTRVGQQTATFIARKDLMVRLGLPRFFRVRDEGVVSATVHNSQDKRAEVRVEMKAEGIELRSPQERTLGLDERSSQTLTWEYSSKTAGTARFTIYALAEGLSDAEERTVPILPHGVELSQAENTLLKDEEQTGRLAVRVPGNRIPRDMGARLTLAPSLAGPVLKSLDYLVGYPYGCVEQTMSQFLPTVLVTRAMGDLGIEAPALSGKLKEVPQMVEKGLSRLYNFQHGDGGWGWWEYDQTDPFMTGYVLYGLARARESGFAVDDGVFQRGMASTFDQLGPSDLDLSTRVYLLYVLSVAGSTDRTMVEKLFERREEIRRDLTPMSLALLVLTLKTQGLEAEARQILEDLIRSAQRADGFVYWEGAKGPLLHWQNDTLLATAAALRAILAVVPEREEAVGAVRYLMSGRMDSDRWRSTLDTAQVVFALVEYLTAKRELFADFDVEVLSAGRTLVSRRFKQQDLFAEPVSIQVPAETLARDRQVEIRKRGRGNLYATLSWSYYSEEEDIPSRQAGPLSIRRDYYRLELEKQSDGTYAYRRTLLPNNAAVKTGDLLLVTLAPRAAEAAEYLMIEDMLPSGFEVIEDIRGWRIEGIPFQEYEYYDWGWWYSHRDVRDDRIAFFSTTFSPGQENELYYVVRAQSPGNYHVMPARIELMYYPEGRGTSPEMRLRVLHQ